MLAELHAGRKASHWMRFVFPQLGALGRSGTARFYGIEDLEHARRQLAHPVLEPRLLACTRAVRPIAPDSAGSSQAGSGHLP